MPADDLLDCISELDLQTDLTAFGIAKATGKSVAYVMGYLGGRFSDRAAEDGLGESPSRNDVMEFNAGWHDGAAVTRREDDGEQSEVA